MVNIYKYFPFPAGELILKTYPNSQEIKESKFFFW